MVLYDDYIPRAFAAPPLPALDRGSDSGLAREAEGDYDAISPMGDDVARCTECGRTRPHVIRRLPLANQPRWCDECFEAGIQAFRRFRRNDDEV